mmetsp:Transcript_22051/g.38834  ORF Transcript_22051/g.38834 Transcript_22051/m.38834 type:complete len:371 (+) Transcript_22051:72-1184(+)
MMHTLAILSACLVCVGQGRRARARPSSAAAFIPSSVGDAALSSEKPTVVGPRLLVLDAQNRLGRGVAAQRMEEDGESTVAPAASGDVEPGDALQRWVRKQTLETLLPREEAIQAIKELGQDTEWINRQRPSYDKLADSLEASLRAETRSFADLLGKESSERILKSLEKVDGDEAAVRAFVKTPAVEGVVGSLLYEGIFEFVNTVDLLGNIVNQLPIIGPVRQQIVKLFKASIDQTLGRQVKSFLGTYSRSATDQLVSLVLSKENARRWADARRKLGDEVLKRPVNSLLPSAKTILQLRDSLWDGLQEQLTVLGDGKLVSEVYDRFGDKSLEGFGVEEVTSGPLRDTPNRILWRFLDSEEGKLFIEGAKRT